MKKLVALVTLILLSISIIFLLLVVIVYCVLFMAPINMLFGINTEENVFSIITNALIRQLEKAGRILSLLDE